MRYLIFNENSEFQDYIELTSDELSTFKELNPNWEIVKESEAEKIYGIQLDDVDDIDISDIDLDIDL